MNSKGIIRVALPIFICLNIFLYVAYAEDFNINVDIENTNEGVWVKGSTDLIITSPDISQITNIIAVAGDREYTLEEILKGKGEDITQNVINKTEYFILTVDKNSYITIYIKDRLDRENIKSYKVSNIDNEEPKLYITPTSTTWRLKDTKVTLSLFAEDSQSGISEVILPDGTSTKNTAINYEIGSDLEYTFIVRDNVGLESRFTYKENKIDTTAPKIDLTTINSEFTKDKVELSISAIDEESGIKYVILPDGDIVYKSDFKYVIYENGTYKFKAVNNAGELSYNTIRVSNIDKDSPIIEFNIINKNNNVDNENTEWSTEKRISISATDNTSEIVGIKTPDGNYINTSFYDYRVLRIGTYGFTVYDKAQNEAYVEIRVDNIDEKYPIIDLKIDKVNNVILVNAIDNESGIKEIIAPDNTIINNNTEYGYTKAGIYDFKVIDVAGNETIRSIKIE